WHLGFDEVFHPLNHGFDSYYGMPSNFRHDPRSFKDREAIAETTDLSMLISNYTQKAVEFIANNNNQPFFLYLAHNYPHVPLVPNPAFAGKSRAGDYGDVIAELDVSMGTILDTLEEMEIAENTLIIFTSDNGPLPQFAQDYKSAGPLRGSKYVTFEGGHRVPAIFYWPKHLPKGEPCEVAISSMDVLPTIAAITGAKLPNDRILDGKNIWPLLMGESKEPPREIEYYYNDRNLQAVRKKDWKMHLPRTVEDIPFWHKGGNKEFKELAEPFLVNLAEDVGESTNVASTNSEIVDQLLLDATAARRELGSSKTTGTAQRKTGDSRVLAQTTRKPSQPNFIILFADDLGFNDLGSYGSKTILTPNLDRMAAEGMRFTDFYAQPICGPSRAALMTGCYPLRVAERDNIKRIHPALHSEEITIAELLKPLGYATGCFGKWDLAKHSQDSFYPDLMPNHQGFDYFFGTPTSNDKKVHLFRNRTAIEKNADMATLTKRYTDEAIGFIQRNKDQPFFVYLPHTMPHTALAASAEFIGKSERGLYGDVVEEIDYNAGRIFTTLKELNLTDNTYVFFISDNGPWLIKNQDFENGFRPTDHGGSAEPLRSGKVSTWEGGVRVPAIAWAPGRIPQGTVCNELASTLDLFPTIAELAGAKLPGDRVIDGENIMHLLSGRFENTNADKTYFYYFLSHLQAVRQGDWKLHIPRERHPQWLGNFAVNKHIHPQDDIGFEKPALYDLETDIEESKDVAKQHPEIVKQLLALAERTRKDLGDHDRVGKNMRFFDPLEQRPTKPIAEWMQK
ncbi:MAG: sulfatase-like hydrolase/transferase, partial [Verrucomicrobia bacterium]|nr:sulfatase-like hydrolase/transferase [Verrucomicrobiota bacterium]